MPNFYRKIQFLCLIIAFIFSFNVSNAEGTKELRPTSLDKGYLLTGSGWSRFASYGCDSLYRLHIQVCNTNETVFFGFKVVSNSTTYFRIKRPDGTDVPGFSHQLVPTSGNGYISTYSSAVAGPASIVGASGYADLSFSPTMTGDYYIEFNDANQTTYSSGERNFEYFDVTVADAGNVAIPGRLWSREWAINCTSYSSPFRGEMYMYSDDQIVTSIKFNDIKPFKFTITANVRGTSYSGDPYTDRKSKSGNINFPQYKIYLNDPDEDCNPTGSYGDVQSISVSGCDPDDRCINIEVDKAGNVDVILDLNGSPGYDEGTVDRLLNANVVVGTNCISWDSRDGLGNYVAPGLVIDVEVHYFNGITHMPLYDVENHEIGYIVELHRPSSGTQPRMFWDDSNFSPGTVETAGCTDVTGCHEWPEDYCGGSCGWGNARTINTYWYGNIITDNTFYNVETIFVDANADTPFGAGNDTTVCDNGSTYQLNGSVTGSTTTGEWSSLTGGTFSDINDLQDTYTFDPSELSSGSATVVLTSTNNGGCPAVSDTLVITIQPGPVVEAGPDQIKCENNPITQLSGTVSVAGGATWSNGLGTYVSDEDDIDAVYTPDVTEAVASNTVKLYLTTTDNGICQASVDSVNISFISTPTVIAGDPIIVCESSSTANLAATFTGATGMEWIGGLGTFSSRTDENATYTPHATEITAGSVILTAQTTNAGGCLDEQDTVTIIIEPTPTVNAGGNQIVCENNADVTLSGSFSDADGIQWSTSGDGTFSDDEDINAIYTPGTADITAGTVTITITSVTAGSCPDVIDDMTITITSGPQAQVGPDQFKCENNANVTLSGTITNATGGTWIGAGTFTPSVTDLNATYTPHADDITDGFAVIILETTGNGDCVAEDDTLLVLFTAAPTVDAGVDQSVCENNPTVNISGTESSGIATVKWSGDGTFGNTNVRNTTYTPSATELSLGTATISFTATTGSCNPVTDEMEITYTDAPTADAGPDVEVCANNAVVNLNGSVTVGTGGVWSTTAGTGSFGDINNLNTTYTPSNDDTTAGSVELYLTTTGSGSCTEVTDTMVISFTPAPTVDAGSDETVCGNNSTVALAGSASVATGGVWSGGTGNFNPSNNNLSTNYTPSDAEINAGTVTLILTTTGHGTCSAVTDNVTITITPEPTVDAGSPISVCKNNPTATLAGSVTISTGGTWSGGDGTISNENSLTSTYLPTDAELTAGSVTLVLTTTGNADCSAETDNVTITYTPSPTIDAGGDQVVCGDLADVSLNAVTTVATGASWTHTGSGTLNDANILNPVYTPHKNDTLVGSVQFTVTSTGQGNCIAVTDQMTVTFQSVPEADAGVDQVACTNEFPVQLDGSGSAAVWTTDGSGTFNNANLLNAAYTPSAADTIAGTVNIVLTTTANGQCAAVSDDMDVSIFSSPIATAGPDQSVCADAGNITLAGSTLFATGGEWSTNGSGSFSNLNDLNGTYTFSNADTANGTVLIFLTTINGNGCSEDVDTMELTITPAPSVFAGGDKTACADVDSVALNGQFFVAGGIQWTSSGTGTFSPNDTTAEAYYVPSANDTIGGGPITLTITSTDNGGCIAVNDGLDLSFTPAPTVTVGPDVTVCADTAGIDISGSVTVATGGTWTRSGSGIFTPSASDLSTTYVPSSADTAAGTVSLYLTTSGNGTCKAVTDSIVVTIDPVPVVDAGPDMIVCGDSTTLTMVGSIQNATGGIWTTSGDGTFPTPAVLTGDYNVGTSDSTNGIVTLFLTSTGSGSCADVSDQLVVTITPPPTVDAGPDQTVCAVNSGVNLSGSVTVASGGIWSTAGGGTFDDINSLSTQYHLDVADTTAGSVQLILTTSGNGTCNAVTDAIDITINSVPVVNAGTDLTVCSDTNFIDLNGTISGGISGLWTSTGTGNFFPNAATLTADYVPTAADTAAGSIVLILSTDGAAPCSEVRDSIVVTFTPAPVVDAGPDHIICADTAGLTLSGSVSVATGGTWTTSGTGSFTNVNDLAATYNPSSLDSAAGSVIVTLTSTGNGDCKEVSDFFELTINPAPVVSSVGDQTICAEQNNVNLNGTVQVASGVVWTSTGTGTFTPNTTTAGAAYTPSAADRTAGSAQLVMTTTGNGLCKAIADTVNLTIDPIPTIDAGVDGELCANGAAYDMSASVTNAGGLLWSSSGSGSFSNTTSPSSDYTPSAADLITGSVYLKVVSTDNGTCSAVADSLELTVTAPPTVSAGPDQEVCDNDDFVQMAGDYSNAAFATWTSSGGGSFDVDTFRTAAYTMSSGDITSGAVTLTYTATGNGSCPSVSELMVLNLEKAPIADAGPDIVVCSSDNTVELDGSFFNATGGGWATDGQGTFNPIADSNSTLTYTFHADDKTAGSVLMEYRAFGNGPCSIDFDTLFISFSAAQVIDAGPASETVCGDTSGVQLGGSGSNGFWSGGNGTYSPDSTALNAIYKPTAAELGGGPLVLTLSTTSTGTCPAVSDQITLTFAASPTVNAGADITVCGDTAGVDVSATINNATGGIWTTSGSGTFIDDLSTNTTYIPSTQDIADSLVFLTFTTSGNNAPCDSASDRLRLYITPAPTVNAGSNQTVCADADSIKLKGSFTIAGNAGWTTNGSGAFSPDTTDMDAYYLLSAADTSAGAIEIYLTTGDNGNCQAKMDTIDVTITPAPTVTISPIDTICASSTSYALSGVVTTATGGKWTTNGTGSFSPSSSVVNPTYKPSADDTVAGDIQFILTTTGNNNCKAYTDTLDLSFDPVPVVSAGADQDKCRNTTSIDLNGSVIVSSTAGWTTTGTGSFAPDTADLAAVYSPTSSDLSGGGLIFTLTSTDNGTCAAVSDVMAVNFNAAPTATVNAGFDQTVCSDVIDIDLSGQVTIAAGGLWQTLGDGTFEDTTDLNTRYFPSANDIAATSVTLVLTTTGNGICDPEIDSMTISFTPTPTVNAGTDTSVCSDINSIQLQGTFTVATGGVWTTTGSGIFSPNEADQSAFYFPSDADKTAGSVGFTYTTTGNGTCNAYSDNKSLTLTKIPTVTAGSDQEICADQASIDLNGKVTIATGGDWTSSGSNSFGNASALITTFTPTTADQNAGIVNLTLTTTGNGKCNPVTDMMQLTINPAPTVDAGVDQTVCENNAAVQLNGVVTVASGGKWTGGTGSFSPNANATNAIYTPSNSELNAGTVTLVLTSTGNDLCNAVSDTVTITITDAPTVSAGNGRLCADFSGTTLDGSFTISTGALWSTSGTGVFSPSASDTNALYTPSQADVSSGLVTLTLTSDGNGNCLAVSDEISLIIKDLPIADAGDDQVICRNSNTTLDASTFTNLSYAWYNLDSAVIGTQASIGVSSISTDTTFVLEVTDGDGCIVYDTTVVAVTDPPVFGLAGQDCFYDTNMIVSNPTPAVNPGVYQWYKNGGLLEGQTADSLQPDGQGSYVIGYSFGDCQTFDTIALTEPQFMNNLIAELCLRDANPEVSIDAGPGNYTYQWEDDLGTPLANTQVYFAIDTGWYYVTVTEQSTGLSCQNTDSVIVISVCPPLLHTANAFIPGGNANCANEGEEIGTTDDCFYIFGSDLENYLIRIFNRWGEVVFQSNDINVSWDGTYKGELVPGGVYPWIITYESIIEEDDTQYLEKGSVTVVR